MITVLLLSSENAPSTRPGVEVQQIEVPLACRYDIAGGTLRLYNADDACIKELQMRNVLKIQEDAC